MAAFVWGDAGGQLTPEQIAERRKVARAMAQRAGDYSPVQHWTQGLARVADGLMSGYEEHKLDSAEKSGRERVAGAMAKFMGGGQAVDNPENVSATPAPAMPAAASPAGGARAAAGDSAEMAFRSLTEQGWSPMHAAVLAGNVQQESSFNPQAFNAKENALGGMQWRLDRQDNLRRFAGDKLNDLPTQLAFIKHEMDGPEAKSGAAFRGAKDIASANAALKSYIRYGDDSEGTRLANAQAILSRFGGGKPAAARAPSMADAAAIMADPFATDVQRSVVMAIVNQGREDTRRAEERANAERTYQRNRADTIEDRTSSQNLTREGWERQDKRDAAALSAKPPTVEKLKQTDGSEVATQWDPQSKTWVPMVAPKGGAAVTAPKLTEGQSKDLGFYDRGAGALKNFDPHEGAMLKLGERTADNIPIINNYLTSEDYQKARQSGREFLAAILRKDTGAAVSPAEEKLYGEIYLPQPGEKPAVVAQKREARGRALEAIRKGLGPAEILAAERPPNAPAAPAAAAPAAPDGQPKQVFTEEEFNALNSGAEFIGPDGKPYRKP